MGRLIFLILGVVSCFQQGVIFEGGRDVLLTDSHWRVTLQYNLTQIEEESRNLSILFEINVNEILKADSVHLINTEERISIKQN
ncbi:hypothetical protein J6590_085868 [Homalodisca vitripennis]|nr:hypothetical protein J6590_085868 [Homalodisca vitripennis]